MNGMYPGRGAKAYAPLRGPSQCVKRSRNTCTTPSQCVKGSCNTCAASSQCVRRPCNTCTASSQYVKGSCNTCAASSQCAKRLCNTCTAFSQCASLPMGTIIHPCGMSGGRMLLRPYMYPANFAAPAGAAPTCTRQTSLASADAPPLPIIRDCECVAPQPTFATLFLT